MSTVMYPTSRVNAAVDFTGVTNKAEYTQRLLDAREENLDAIFNHNDDRRHLARYMADQAFFAMREVGSDLPIWAIEEAMQDALHFIQERLETDRAHRREEEEIAAW